MKAPLRSRVNSPLTGRPLRIGIWYPRYSPVLTLFPGAVNRRSTVDSGAR